MHFRRRNKTLTPITFKLGDGRLQNVKSYRYLGIIVDEFLTMEEAINQLSTAGSRAVGKVIRKSRSNLDLGFHSYSKLYDCCVAPVLDYACGAWNAGLECSKIDQIQHRAIRYYCGLPRTTPVVGLISEMNWVPSIVRRDLKTVCLYNQIVRMPRTRINRQVFEFELNSEQNGEWRRNLLNIAEHVEMLDLVSRREPLQITTVKRKLLQMHSDMLKTSINSKSKLRTYCLLKMSMETEGYLKANLDKHKRSLISRLRLGVLGLRIETGRFSQISYENRICELCKKHVENEVHFVLECPMLADVRVKHFAKIPELSGISDNIEKLKYLCTMPYRLGNLLTQLWQSRNHLIKV